MVAVNPPKSAAGSTASHSDSAEDTAASSCACVSDMPESATVTGALAAISGWATGVGLGAPVVSTVACGLGEGDAAAPDEQVTELPSVARVHTICEPLAAPADGEGDGEATGATLGPDCWEAAAAARARA